MTYKLIQEELVKHRRTIHEFAEIGFDLKKTSNYVMNELNRMEIAYERIGKSGIVGLIGKEGPTILLRADMDALPMEEKTGLEFSAKNGNCHACGHDAHTAMLLGAGQLLKNQETKLKGRIKLMFQPAEELLAGALDMVENGVLENPRVDAAIALHVIAGEKEAQSGNIYFSRGYINYSGDAVKITIIGREAHGSRPDLGVDSIQIASKILQEIYSLKNNYFPPGEDIVILVGKIAGGSAVNTVADKTSMEISLRSRSEKTRQRLLDLVEEKTKKLAQALGGEAIFQHMYGMPSIYNDDNLLNTSLKHLEEKIGKSRIKESKSASGSEDFSIISEKIPSIFLQLGVGSIDEGYTKSLHQGDFLINEDVLSLGAYIYSELALNFIDKVNKHKKI